MLDITQRRRYGELTTFDHAGLSDDVTDFRRLLHRDLLRASSDEFVVGELPRACPLGLRTRGRTCSVAAEGASEHIRFPGTAMLSAGEGEKWN